jgi:lambda family phage portal protein
MFGSQNSGWQSEGGKVGVYIMSNDKAGPLWPRLKEFFTSSSYFKTSHVDEPYRTASRQEMPDWNPSSSNADEALIPSLSALRNQSRDLDRNESLARGPIENYVTNVVADGLRPQARIDHELLEIPEAKAREFERQAERIFELHMRKNTADFHGKANFPTLQAQVLRAVLLDGDCLVIRRYRERTLGILPVSLQLIEGARLRYPAISLNPKTDIREGVELDATGMPVAYHVAKTGTDQFLGAETVRVPRFDDTGAPAVLHIFSKRLPEQSRGEPLLAPVIKKFKEISDYTEAEIRAAVVNAFFAIYVTSEMGSVFGDRASAHLARQQEERPRERKFRKFGPGGLMVDLLPGEKVDNGAPGRPNSNFDPFVQAVIKQIGIGLGLPYEVLTQHYSSSYSAARAAILEAWKSFKVWRAWLVSEFCQPVWEWVISDAIERGLLDAPGFEDPLKRHGWLSTQWAGTEMGSIDPLKDAKANEVEVSAGLRTRRSIVESQGRDFDKHVRDHEAEKRTFSENVASPEFDQASKKA